MKTLCPYCSQKVEYEKSQGGNVVPCPACEKPYILPKFPWWKTMMRWIISFLKTLFSIFTTMVTFIGDLIVVTVTWCVAHWLGLVGVLFLIFTLISGVLTVILTVGIGIGFAPMVLVLGFGFGFVLMGLDSIINKK